MRKTTYVSINPIPADNDNLNELKISVDYYKGGINYFNGTRDKRGIYVYFTPILRGESFTKSVMLGGVRSSGFKTFLVELGRKSDKRIDEVFAKIEPLKDKIGELYDKCDFMAIHNLVTDEVNK